MMTRTLIYSAVAVLLAGLTGPAWSQEQITRPLPPLLSVSQGLTAHGHGEVKVKPDIARLTADVTTHDKRQAPAVQDNARRMTALITAIKGLGIADRDIGTQGYTVNPQYEYSDGRAHLTGYEVTNSALVTLRDLTQAGTLIDTVTQVGVNQLSGVSYDLSDRAASQDQALALAVADARRRATAMASALGVTLGGPLSLSDSEVAPVQPIFAPRVMAYTAVAPAPTPIMAQEITATADVTLLYALGAAK